MIINTIIFERIGMFTIYDGKFIRVCVQKYVTMFINTLSMYSQNLIRTMVKFTNDCIFLYFGGAIEGLRAITV